MTSTTFTSVLEGLDFSVLTTYYLQVVGIAVPVIVGILAIKKGIRWILGFIGRA